MTSYGKFGGYNQFETVAQSIWAEKNLSVKKQRAIDEVVSQFKFKDKIPYFTRQINSCTSNTQVDKILTNIVLHGEGLSSLK